MAERIWTERVTGEINPIGINCGNNSINKKLEEAYTLFLLRQGYTYAIRTDTKLLGYYMVTFRKISVHEWETHEINDYMSNMSQDYFSLHLQVIAIDEKYQHHGVGTMILRDLMKQAKELSLRWPIRFMTLDALSDKYKWYNELGFKPINVNENYASGYYIRMYYDCIECRDTIEDYFEATRE